jgi:poly(3-hydroxyalkanoate) depolymerase
VALSEDAVRVVDVDGLRLRVAVRECAGARTPLLLVNGIGASLESFQPFLDALDPALTVIRFDPPGVGGSPAPARRYRLPALARALGRVVHDMGHPRVDVLGISWGGALAQQFAFTQMHRCRKLVLVATSAGAVMIPASPVVLAKMATPRRFRDPDYLMRIAADLYGGALRRDTDRLRPLVHAFGRPDVGHGYRLQLIAGLGWTSVPFLRLLPQRTLVLAGDDDPIIPQVNGRFLAAMIRRATFHVYPGGHVDLVADPALLTPMIEEFLTAAGPERSRGRPGHRGTPRTT